MFLAEIALRDDDEAGEACFGGQLVIKTRVKPALAEVVTDGEQGAFGVV